jgi:hypothetical protein
MIQQERTQVRRFAQTFAANAKAPREARRMIESWSDQVDPDILHTLRLLVSEVIGLSVPNGDIHADDGPPVELSVEFDERRVRVEALCDTGAYSFSTAPAEVAGLSFALIDELSDRWGVCRGGTGTRCWLEIDGWPGAFSFSVREL